MSWSSRSSLSNLPISSFSKSSITLIRSSLLFETSLLRDFEVSMKPNWIWSGIMSQCWSCWGLVGFLLLVIIVPHSSHRWRFSSSSESRLMTFGVLMGRGRDFWGDLGDEKD